MLHNIYLAAPYGRREYLRKEIAPVLRGWGHHITSSWINDPPENDEIANYLRARRRGEGEPVPTWDQILTHEALRDELDVRHSSMLIRFPATDTAVSGGGKFWETGFAAAMGLTIAVIGHRETVFDYLPSVHIFPTFAHALTRLELTA